MKAPKTFSSVLFFRAYSEIILPNAFLNSDTFDVVEGLFEEFGGFGRQHLILLPPGHLPETV